MIFVALGTLDNPFPRLLQAVEKQIIDGVIRESVVVQAGMTTYKSGRLKVINLFPMKEFENNIKSASLIICHAGYGTLSIALAAGKKVIAAARQFEYGEHINNHQNQILDAYEKKGYLLALREFSKLGDLLNKAQYFTPVRYEKNNHALQRLISGYIDNDNLLANMN
jgi:UDP-N-acetylglucosamine transferase subunit ALG13